LSLSIRTRRYRWLSLLEKFDWRRTVGNGGTWDKTAQAETGEAGLTHGETAADGYHFTGYTAYSGPGDRSTKGTPDQTRAGESAHYIIEKSRADTNGIIHQRRLNAPHSRNADTGCSHR
jgi:hypothetical protein